MTGSLWQIGFCKPVSFELFLEGGSRCCTEYIVRKIIPHFKSIKSKTMAKVFDLLVEAGVESRNLFTFFAVAYLFLPQEKLFF